MQLIKDKYSQKRKLLWRKACVGWGIWHRIIKQYKVGPTTAVVLLPKNDLENSYFALLYLDRMLSIKEYRDAVIIVPNEMLEKASKIMCHKINKVVQMTESRIDALLQFYMLCKFDHRFYVTSLDDIPCRNGRELIGVHGIGVEEMVAIGIYQIIPYVQKERPDYSGNDIEMKKFMEIGGENKHEHSPLNKIV